MEIDPLNDLREILLSEDKHRIAKLEEDVSQLINKLDDKDELIETLNPILAALLEHKISNSKDEMAEALAPLMGDAIRKQVEDSQDDVIDALYPIVGQMVSKAIKEAMKGLIDAVNRNINRRLGFGLWFKRLKARVLGIEIGEVLIAEEAPFGIAELFLISKPSGLLIAHLSPPGKKGDQKEAQIIAGMLIAIKHFVQDAFSTDQSEELEEIEYSGHSIRLDAGRYTYLAAVYNGIAPEDLSAQMRKFHQKIHFRFFKLLREYQGDNSTLQKVEPILKKLIQNFEY